MTWKRTFHDHSRSDLTDQTGPDHSFDLSYNLLVVSSHFSALIDHTFDRRYLCVLAATVLFVTLTALIVFLFFGPVSYKPWPKDMPCMLYPAT